MVAGTISGTSSYGTRYRNMAWYLAPVNDYYDVINFSSVSGSIYLPSL